MYDTRTNAPKRNANRKGSGIIATTVASESPPTSIRDTIGAQSAIEAITWLNLLIYGDPGSGKTWLSGTAEDHPATSPVLLIDIEGGATTLRNRPGVDVVSIRSIAELVALHKRLYEENNGHYKTVVLDTLTELQKLDMRDIMRELVNKRPDLDPDVPSQREWGKSGEHVRRIVRAFRDLPMNTIMTAHSHSERDANNALTYFPSLPGKLRAEIPGFLDIVGYLFVAVEDGETHRKLQVAKTQRVVAKDRTSALDDVTTNPTIPMLWNKIHDPQAAVKPTK